MSFFFQAGQLIHRIQLQPEQNRVLVHEALSPTGALGKDKTNAYSNEDKLMIDHLQAPQCLCRSPAGTCDNCRQSGRIDPYPGSLSGSRLIGWTVKR